MRFSAVVSKIRHTIFILFVASIAFAQDSSSPAGKWISNLKFFQENNYQRLQLNLTSSKLTGKLGNNAFEGTYENGRIEGTVKPNPQTTIKLQGMLIGDRIEGTATVLESKIDLRWDVQRELSRATTSPKTHVFEP